MRAHPLAEIFPLLEGDAFDRLVADIREHGQHERVIVWDGQILDGRNRWRACEAAGIEPKTQVFEGDDRDALALVLSLNLHRRHLDESQRAMVAARAANLQQDVPVREAVKRAAEGCNVSERSAFTARKVLAEGSPEIVRAVDAGRLPVSTAVKVLDKPQEKQRAFVAELESGIPAPVAVRHVRRDERIERIASISAGNAPLTLPQRYPVILADPPWRYRLGPDFNGAAEGHYPTMSPEEICALPVSDLATDDAILFLWTTSPKIAEAVRVLDAWGFEHKTCAVWTKDRAGLGFYFRQQHELLFVATRGDWPAPKESDRPSSVIVAPRGEHSEKPSIVHEIIERMYPELPRVELFARAPREGWAAWGNQASGAAA